MEAVVIESLREQLRVEHPGVVRAVLVDLREDQVVAAEWAVAEEASIVLQDN